MRRSLTVSSLFFVFFTAGSSIAGDVSHPKFSVETAEVTAERCSEICELVTVRMQIRNETESLLCIPSVYDDKGAYGAIYFRYDDVEEPVTPPKPYDPNVFYSLNYKTDVLKLATLPQYVIQPNGSTELYMVLFEKYDLNDKPAVAFTRIVGFNCLQNGSGQPAAYIYDLSQRVVFTKWVGPGNADQMQ